MPFPERHRRPQSFGRILILLSLFLVGVRPAGAAPARQDTPLAEALQAAIERHKESPRFDYYYRLLEVVEEGEWGIGKAEQVWKDTQEIIPADFSVILAHRDSSGDWQVVLPNEADPYLDVLEGVPGAVLGNTTKAYIRAAYRPSGVTLYAGHYLPWTRGSAARVYRNYSAHGEGQLDLGFSGSIRTSKAGTLVFAYDAHTWSECTGQSSCNFANAWYYNNTVVIKHADGEYSAYLHLQTGSIPDEIMSSCGGGMGGACTAVALPAGTIIGTVGSIGLSTGPHLHYETGDYVYGSCSYPDVYDEDGDGDTAEKTICTGGIVGNRRISTGFYEKPYSAPGCGTEAGQDPTLCMLYFPRNTNLVSQNEQPCPALTDSVRLFDLPYCGPPSFDAEPGLTQLEQNSFNNKTESIAVPIGWSARLYQNTSENPNASKCFTATDTSLADDKFANGQPVANDVTWVRVYSSPDCTLPAGDADGDGRISGIDYVIWKNHYGQAVSGGPPAGDFDDDGTVDEADYSIWLAQYGGGPSAPSQPEPGLEAAKIFFRPTGASVLDPLGVDLVLDSGSQAAGFVRVDAAFDPAEVRLVQEVQPGGQLKRIIQHTTMVDANASGRITLILGLAHGDPAPSGEHTLAHLRFEAAPGFAGQSAALSFAEGPLEIVRTDAAVLPIVAEPGAIVLSSFGDVGRGYWAWSFIERLYGAGVTGGCGLNPLKYCPEGTVTRGQMAVFLLRGIHGSAYSPPPVGDETGFGDVPTDYWSAAFIKQLAAEGITAGCGGGNYCPEAAVNRAQMAVFLLRAKYGSAYSPPGVGTSTGFGDVPPDYWAAAFIKQLVAEGITAGCGSGNYCPEAPVTRAQMAVFLVRTFGLP